jgi:glutaredoxin
MIAFSTHPSIVGKPAKDSGINLGYGWTTLEASWEDIFELITTDGCATSAALSSDNRKEATFVSRQLLMVDVDSGMTIPELLEHPFYNEYGAGFYATPSFTVEKHKFRICFVLDYAETNATRLRKINRGLLKVFGEADEACKDPTRIFYGNPNCVLKERTDRLLTKDIADYLIAIIEQEEQAQAEAMALAPKIEYELTNDRRDKIIQLLSKIYLGEYALWRNVGWGMKAGGFTLQDFQYVTQFMMSQKTKEDAAKIWRAGSANGQITMGSVIHLLKTRLGEDCLKETDQDRVNKIYSKAETELNRIKEKMKKWQ